MITKYSSHECICCHRVHGDVKAKLRQEAAEAVKNGADLYATAHEFGKTSSWVIMACEEFGVCKPRRRRALENLKK